MLMEGGGNEGVELTGALGLLEYMLRPPKPQAPKSIEAKVSGKH